MSHHYQPVDRRANVICHNAKCSMCDPVTNACRINVEMCADKQSKPTTDN